MGRITIALAKGRLFQKSMDVFRKVGITAPDLEENSRLLVIPGCGHVQAYLKDPQAYEEAVEALLGQTLGAFWGAAPNPAAC